MLKEYNEGLADIFFDKAFVNSRAKLNRDIGIAIVGHAPGKNMLDATSASGIRGIRYMLEANVGFCTSLEINHEVFAELEANIKRNNSSAVALNTSIQEFCNSTKERFWLVELDPFGGIYPYIFDIAKVLRGGSYLFATATDAAVLCGAHKAACLKLYSAKPMHDELCHEVGLRIMIGYIARTLAQFNFGIDVLLGIFHDHYMRVYIRVESGASASLNSIKSMGFAMHCAACGHIETQKGFVCKELSCPECSGRMSVAGPLWLGSLKDAETAKRISEYSMEHEDKRLKEFSEKILEELDIPLFYSMPSFTKRMHKTGISPASVIATLKEMGFKASYTHFDSNSIKSSADAKTVENAVRSCSDTARKQSK